MTRGETFVEVESVKSVNDCYAPVTGEVVAINEALQDQPELVNQDPQAAGWFCRVKPADAEPLAGLLDEDAYQKLIRQ